MGNIYIIFYQKISGWHLLKSVDSMHCSKPAYLLSALWFSFSVSLLFSPFCFRVGAEARLGEAFISSWHYSLLWQRSETLRICSLLSCCQISCTMYFTWLEEYPFFLVEYTRPSVNSRNLKCSFGKLCPCWHFLAPAHSSWAWHLLLRICLDCFSYITYSFSPHLWKLKVLMKISRFGVLTFFRQDGSQGTIMVVHVRICTKSYQDFLHPPLGCCFAELIAFATFELSPIFLLLTILCLLFRCRVGNLSIRSIGWECYIYSLGQWSLTFEWGVEDSMRGAEVLKEVFKCICIPKIVCGLNKNSTYVLLYFKWIQVLFYGG